MLHPIYKAEGMGWGLSPPELREGSRAWPLAPCQAGVLHPALWPAALALCAEGAVGKAPQPGLCQAVPGLSSSRVGLCQGRPPPLRELPPGCDTNWAPAG